MKKVWEATMNEKDEKSKNRKSLPRLFSPFFEFSLFAPWPNARHLLLRLCLFSLSKYSISSSGNAGVRLLPHMREWAATQSICCKSKE